MTTTQPPISSEESVSPTVSQLHLPPTAALDAQEIRTVSVVEFEPETEATHRVGLGFIVLYGLAYTGFWLSVLTPGLIALPLKATSLAGPERGASLFSLVLGITTFVGMFANPIVGKLSDRTTSRLGMRRPWILLGALANVVGMTLIAVAPNVPVLLIVVCVYGFFGGAAGAALVGVLPDQVPVSQRGVVSGVLGVSLPVGLIAGTFLVQAVSPNLLLMFAVPSAVAALFVLPFVLTLKDRRLDPADKPVRQPGGSLRDVATTFWVSPRQHPDFAWVFGSRFLLVLAYAFLTGFQAFYLLNKLKIAAADIPQKVFLATLVLASVTILSSLLGGKLSDATGRRKPFVLVAAVVYGAALFIAANANSFNGFLISMAVAGIGFGAYAAVDLALVTDVLPDPDNVGKDMGVFNIASTLPQTVAPALAPAILAIGSGSYSVLYAVAGVAALLSAVAILPVRKVR